MRNEDASREKRESVYAEGKLAFDEHKRRGYNPYVRSNLTLAVNWWHGWDTAEEESKGKSETLPGSSDNLKKANVT